MHEQVLLNSAKDGDERLPNEPRCCGHERELHLGNIGPVELGPPPLVSERAVPPVWPWRPKQPEQASDGVPLDLREPGWRGRKPDSVTR